MSRNAMAAGVTALLLVCTFPVIAGSLAISPVKLTLSSASGITSITVENSGKEEALVQTETFAWSQVGGEHKLNPTDDVVAVPPVFRLAPGAKRVVRVGTTKAFTELREQTFRLTVTEVPTAVKPGTIAVTIRHSLPIFVRPLTAISSVLAVKIAGSGGLEIANNGGQHLRIDRWRLLDSAGNVTASDSGPGYLLSGASQVLKVAGNRIVGPSVFEADSEARTLKIAVGP